MSFSKNIKILFIVSGLMMPLMSYGMTDYLLNLFRRPDLKIVEIPKTQKLADAFAGISIKNPYSVESYIENNEVEDLKSVQNFLDNIQAAPNALEQIQRVVKEIAFQNRDLEIFALKLRAETDAERNRLVSHWHIDDRPCTSNTSKYYRIILPVMLSRPGLGTQFTQLTPEQRLFFSKLYCDRYKNEVNRSEQEHKEIDDIVSGNVILQLEVGQAAIFNIGNMKTGVVHRKPPIIRNQKRLLMVLECSKK